MFSGYLKFDLGIKNWAVMRITAEDLSAGPIFIKVMKSSSSEPDVRVFSILTAAPSADVTF